LPATASGGGVVCALLAGGDAADAVFAAKPISTAWRSFLSVSRSCLGFAAPLASLGFASTLSFHSL
jgi:hypothetical protein